MPASTTNMKYNPHLRNMPGRPYSWSSTLAARNEEWYKVNAVKEAGASESRHSSSNKLQNMMENEDQCRIKNYHLRPTDHFVCCKNSDANMLARANDLSKLNTSNQV